LPGHKRACQGGASRSTAELRLIVERIRERVEPEVNSRQSVCAKPSPDSVVAGSPTSIFSDGHREFVENPPGYLHYMDYHNCLQT